MRKKLGLTPLVANVFEEPRHGLAPAKYASGPRAPRQSSTETHLTPPGNAGYTHLVTLCPLRRCVLDRPSELVVRAWCEGRIGICSEFSLRNGSGFDTRRPKVYGNQLVPSADEVVRLYVPPHNPKVVQSDQDLA